MSSTQTLNYGKEDKIERPSVWKMRNATHEAQSAIKSHLTVWHQYQSVSRLFIRHRGGLRHTERISIYPIDHMIS
jgi:hypothetical protein